MDLVGMVREPVEATPNHHFDISGGFIAKQIKIDPLTKFLLWFAAVDIKILEQINRPIKIHQYTAFGLLILIACLFAGGSAFVFITSFNTASIDNHIKIVFSFIWSVFVFSIDRYLLTSFNKINKKLLLPLLFRGVMCFLISFFISTTLESYFFESEISSQLLTINLKKIQEAEDKFINQIYNRSDIKPISTKIQSLNNTIKN